VHASAESGQLGADLGLARGFTSARRLQHLLKTRNKQLRFLGKKQACGGLEDVGVDQRQVAVAWSRTGSSPVLEVNGNEDEFEGDLQFKVTIHEFANFESMSTSTETCKAQAAQGRAYCPVTSKEISRTFPVQ
jgi:hypothetical protein